MASTEALFTEKDKVLDGFSSFGFQGCKLVILKSKMDLHELNSVCRHL